MTETPIARARGLLSRMTLEEKAQQITAVMGMGLVGLDGPTKPQLEKELSGGIGHISMYTMFGHLSPAELARNVNTIQRYLIEETRLGIPAIFHIETLNGLVAPGFTTYPTALALAATWNPAGVQKMAATMAGQMRAIGHGQALSPVMDVARDARWGRVHESYGEDPYLVSELSVAFTRGLQGENVAEGAIATGKHFLGFGMTEGGQHMAATAIAGRELREVYARPFEAAIREARLGSIMNSYSTVDGIPVGANRQVLTELLRDELGFEGTVVSDYGTIANLFDRQGVATDLKDAGRLALEAGLDVELPAAKGYGPTLVDAVHEGLVPEDLVDRSVLRILRDKFALGLFDHPYVDEDAALLGTAARAGADLAGELAHQSITLLSNDGTLPLRTTVRKIAVIGPHADSVGVNFPGYTHFAAVAMMAAAADGESINMAGAEDSGESISPEAAEALGSQLGPQLQDGLEEYGRRLYGAQSLVEAVRATVPDAVVVSVEGCGVLDEDPRDFAAAAEAAADADVVILALGGRPGWFGTRMTEGEGSDRANIDLPSVQVELARHLAALGKPTVGVVLTGRPFNLTELDEVLPSLVYGYYGGQAGMAAVADVLFGKVNPSGKLPLSLPRHSGQVPLHHGQHLGSGYRRTDADAHKGYNDLSSRPLYAFGHGLSYTTFEYSDLTPAESEISTRGLVRATATITNTGARAGTEIVQFYASHRARLVTRPAQELVGFARVDLEAGESATVELAFSTGQLAYLGPDGRFVFESGPIELTVGRSSEDIRESVIVQAIGPSEDWSTMRPLLSTVRVLAEASTTRRTLPAANS